MWAGHHVGCCGGLHGAGSGKRPSARGPGAQEAFDEATVGQLDAALRAALAAAGHLVGAWPAQRLRLLYAGVLLLEAAPRGELGSPPPCPPPLGVQQRSC